MTREEIKSTRIGQTIYFTDEIAAIVRGIDIGKEIITLEAPVVKAAEDPMQYLSMTAIRGSDLPVEEPPDVRPTEILVATKTTVILPWRELAAARRV
jgi:hypothetical protein